MSYVYVVDTNFFIQAHRVSYTQNAIQEFLDADEADTFLMAFTLADLLHKKIVTYEKPSNKKNKIKIPDVCEVFGIKYTDPITMFRELGESF